MTYKKHSELGPDSIEKWAMELDRQSRNTELSDDNADIMIRLLMSPDKFNTDDFDKEAKTKIPLYKIFSSRLEKYHTFKIDNCTKYFFVCLSNSPGEIVMWLNYLQFVWSTYTSCSGIINLDFICSTLFPFGVFSKEAMQEAWDNQKVERPEGTMDSDNMLDYPMYMESIKARK